MRSTVKSRSYKNSVSISEQEVKAIVLAASVLYDVAVNELLQEVRDRLQGHTWSQSRYRLREVANLVVNSFDMLDPYAYIQPTGHPL